MKLLKLWSIITFLSLSYAAVIEPQTSALTKDKRWTVSSPKQTGAQTYTVTVISGIIVSHVLEQCRYQTGADWAGAFAEALIQYYANVFGHKSDISGVEGFYPTSDTVGLYCTTLAVRVAFKDEGWAKLFTSAAREYMQKNLKGGTVSEVDESLPELPELPDTLPEDTTDMEKRDALAGCKKTCKFNFGKEDTGICHDDWGKISRHHMTCKP